MDGVRDEAEAGRAHQYDLEDPVTNVGNREGFVVAGLVTAGLESVTDEHCLLVLVHRLPNDGHDQDTEDHHHCQEDPSRGRQR